MTSLLRPGRLITAVLPIVTSVLATAGVLTRNRIIAVLGLILYPLVLTGLAQALISVYAGPALPVNGAQASTQFVEGAVSIVADGLGGFYVLGRLGNYQGQGLNRIYRI